MSFYFAAYDVFCEIHLNKSVESITLLDGNDGVPFKRNDSQNSYYLNFSYIKDSPISIQLISPRNDEWIDIKITFSIKNKLFEERTYSRQLWGAGFLIEIEKLDLSNKSNKSSDIRKSSDESDFLIKSDNAPYLEEIEWSNLDGIGPDLIVLEKNNPETSDKLTEGKIEVFYATNRKKTGDNDPNLFFGDDLDELNTGKCIINIPAGHKTGAIERPRKILWWQFNENTDKHVTLDLITEIEGETFFNMMKKDVLETESQSCLLFVHGYNTTFSEAAWRTGQIAYDMPFNGLMGFFSWPSSGKTLDYFGDIEKADSSVDILEKFIIELVIKSNIKKLHIVAHSMGSRVVTSALKNLCKNQDFKEQLDSIHQIVLAAPDLDQSVFGHSILPTLKSIGKSRTLYASEHDKAMRISETIRSMPRLGKGGTSLFVADGLESIDASNVMSPGNHHSYIFETNSLLADLFLLFDGVTDPSKRRLKQADHQGLKYWYFPL